MPLSVARASLSIAGTREHVERPCPTAALLADEVLRKPLRRWVLSLPFALRFLLATYGPALTEVLGIVYQAISGYILKKARLTRSAGGTGA